MRQNVTRSKPTLVLFTLKYPYSDYTEVFLDTELPYASKNFGNIIICHFGKERVEVRQSAISHIGIPVDVVGIPEMPKLAPSLMRTMIRLLPGSIVDIVREHRARSKRSDPVNRKTMVYQILRLGWQAESLRRTLRPLLEGGGVPVFYSYWFSRGAYLAALMAREFGGKSVSRAHAGDIYHHIYGYGNFHQSTIRRIDSVFACSDDGMNYLHDDLPNERTKIHRSYLGCSESGPKLKKDHIQRDDYDALHIVSCANIDRNKRLDRLVDALMLTGSHQILWTHIGGPDSAWIHRWGLRVT